MKQRKEDTGWCWPTQGLSAESLQDQINQISSPYDETLPPLCYPGTPLDQDLLPMATQLLSKQINAIGTHTHGHRGCDGKWQAGDGEGGFDTIQKMEREAIWMIASVLGGSPEQTDGYFCGGGTESNLQGILIGRQWLRQRPDPHNRGIVIFTTSLIHYSVIKAAEITDLGRHQYAKCSRCEHAHLFLGDVSGRGVNFVGMNAQGQMSVQELRRVFALKYQEGFRLFMIVPTIGTTATGSIDPIDEIEAFVTEIHRETDAHFYLHLDASFGGFTAPFSQNPLAIGFEHSSVMSMTLDGDKMGHLPYPGGVFLCRKGLQQLASRRVEYVGGHNDDTVPGSRTALAPALAWYRFKTLGLEGHRHYVQRCIKLRDILARMIATEFPPSTIHAMPTSPHTNFLPLSFGDKHLPEMMTKKGGILAPYHMRSDFFPQDPSDVRSCPVVVYKICIMPHHTQDHLERFVQDLHQAFN